MTELYKNKSACFGCGACKAVCPFGAITMKNDAEGFLYPSVDDNLCTDCGLCAETCPIDKKSDSAEGKAFAVRCSDPSLLKNSSSGGAFSLLAKQVIDQGGLICGAVYDESFYVHHVMSDDITPMRKSKYIQSDTEGIYSAIASALDSGKSVLFTGAPCQCDGVRRFFGGDKEGLVLVSLVCRGVQSPALWKDYVSFISDGGRLEAYCSRDKRSRNGGHTVAYTVDGQERALPMDKDPWSRLYLKGLTLRPSCYKCPYTRFDLPFDITVGDFWGVEKRLPELADGMGTSLVVARSEKGLSLIEALCDSETVIPVTQEDARQPALTEPAKETLLRKLLFRDFAQKNEDGSCNIPLILKKYGG